MIELVNTHCHTGFCGHGAGAVHEYVREAKNAGLSLLAFTDHYPLSPHFDPDAYLSVAPSDLFPYVQAVRSAQKEHPDMEILLGIEMDYLGSLEDRTIPQNVLNKFDFILGSVHFIDGWAFDDPAQRERWEEPYAADAIWKRYVELWCEAASDTSLPFDVMSHPDLAKKFGYYPSYPLEPLYSQMAEAAKAGNRMVEVNTSGAYYACKEAFPSLALLQAFCKAGIPCTVGSDAHQPSNVARDIEKGYKLMQEAGYTEVTVPTRSRDRRTIALSF